MGQSSSAAVRVEDEESETPRNNTHDAGAHAVPPAHQLHSPSFLNLDSSTQNPPDEDWAFRRRARK